MTIADNSWRSGNPNFNLFMPKAKYFVDQHPISIVLAWIEQGKFAILEIQRPFFWHETHVRDLMDSLAQGLPRI